MTTIIWINLAVSICALILCIIRYRDSDEIPYALSMVPILNILTLVLLILVWNLTDKDKFYATK